MKLNEKFPDLEQFFGCYFHQDWMEEYENEEMAIKEYVDDDGREAARHVAVELDKILALCLPEPQLEQAMYKELGCCCNPKPDGMSMSGWLRWVRVTLIKYEQLAPKWQ